MHIERVVNMAKSNKIRLSIPLSAELHKKLEDDADKLGVSKATYAAIIIGNHYKSLDASMQKVEETLKEMFKPYIDKLDNGNEIVTNSVNEANNDLTQLLGSLIQKDEK